MQSQTVTDVSGPRDWSPGSDTYPVKRLTLDLPGFAPGTLVSIRLRAFGTKGAGPWCDPVTARVP